MPTLTLPLVGNATAQGLPGLVNDPDRFCGDHQ